MCCKDKTQRRMVLGIGKRNYEGSKRINFLDKVQLLKMKPTIPSFLGFFFIILLLRLPHAFAPSKNSRELKIQDYFCI